MIGGGYMSLPPLFAPMAAAGWNATGLQQAWAAIPMGSILGALVAARSVERWGNLKVISSTSVLAAVSILVRAGTNDIGGLSLALAVYGAATGALLATLTTVVGQLAPVARSGFAQGVFFGSYALGAAVALIGAETIVRHFNWQTACIIVGSASLLLALFSGRVAHFGQRSVETVREPVSVARSMAAGRLSLRYCGAYAAYVGGYLALAGLLPYQLERWGWPRDAASLSLAITTLAFLVGAGIWTAITDAFGKRRTVFALTMFVSGAATAAIVPLAGTQPNALAWTSIVIVGLFSGGMGVFFPMLLGDERLGPMRGATSVGHATAASYVGGAAVPFLLANLSIVCPEVSVILFGVTIALAGVLAPKGMRKMS
ncbi:MAG: MFS transporter [Aquidulcibacter sp.]|uniref:MFS transporter n=1 Tax=Aquidulcibacter sp. TaxID=2052990 RepID=UPI0022BB1F23|nr:MFS transporter [Aquidulcibacter sp.]MCZ8208152.1 MFS transporter [Aquidulcibacter sp.]